MTNSNLKIGYVITTSTNLGYLGAILVSDEKGFPLEFQYTDPILPTKLQKVLYGNSLEKYLKVDVILDNLLKVLSNKVDLLIVKDEQLLDAHNLKTDIIRVSETNNTLDNKENFSVEKIKEDEYIFQYSKIATPVRVTFAEKTQESDSTFEKVSSIIREIGLNIDITEPLERVQKSIDVIISKDNE